MFALLLALMISPVFAQVFEGPVSAALGGSGRAGMDANEGAFLNPALIPLLHPESALYYRDGSADLATHRHAIGVSLSETQDVLIPGELSYMKLRNTGVVPTAVDGELWFGGIGFMFLQKFSVGLSVYHLQQKPVGLPSNEQWNGSLGGLFLIMPTLGVAYVLENPVHPAGFIPEALRLAPKQSFGIFYRTPYRARLRLDLIRQEQFNPDKKINLHTSVESEMSEFMVMRLGGRWDERENQRFITAGLGFNGPKLKIDYAFEKNLAHASGAVHSVDMRVSF